METLKILVIDDDNIFITLVRRLLPPVGYEVVSAKSFMNGLAAVQRTPDIDVILLDLALPDTIDARATLRQFFVEHTDIAVCVCSNMESQEIMALALRYGAQAYLKKSNLSTDSLQSAIFHAYQAKRIQLENRRQRQEHARYVMALWQRTMQVFLEEGRQRGDDAEHLERAAEEISDAHAALYRSITRGSLPEEEG